ncbi:MAG: pilus assembly protein N-terminal domain-containing protein [Negativicutes bacterium]|nr:pilus assembly protein N-terminal domain-containing protein [Negativicutes bacterium]
MDIKRVGIITFLVAALFFCAAPLSQAADKLEVAVNQSRILSFAGVERVAVANPEIADVVVVSGTEIMLVGKASGITNVHVWTAGSRQSYIVEVAKEDTPIAGEIKYILGYPDVRVTKIGKTIILEGTVNDRYQKDRAAQVAGAYGEKVVNLLELTRPVQVKIEAKVLEINRTNAKDLGIKWGERYIDKFGVDQYGNFTAEYHDNPPGVFGGGQLEFNPINSKAWGNLGTFRPINTVIDALVKKGDAKILSQPNIITLSGDKANILVGGQIPVPVASMTGAITVDWKDYGIKLEIEPSVNADGLINSKIKAEVSDLDWSSSHQIVLSANLRIPPITTRKAEASIALSSGQTMAIGGLIANKTEENLMRVPYLSEIPVLGKLFRSKSFSRGETELIILITPTIINPAEYLPQTTTGMQEFSKQDPWGGKNNERKDKGANR